jgi:hypothetical protein
MFKIFYLFAVLIYILSQLIYIKLKLYLNDHTYSQQYLDN